MADEIVLAPRQVNGEIIEGETHLQINEEITKDIEIIMPNKDSRYVTREALESGKLNLSILGGVQLLAPLNNAIDFKGIFRVSDFIKYPTYDGVPSSYILEISEFPDFSVIKKSFIRTDFNSKFTVSFEEGNKTLYARVRTETDLHISNNSPIVKFRTIDSFSHAPVIITPVNNATNVAWELYCKVSEYMYINRDNYCDGLVVSYSKNPSFPTDETIEYTLYRDSNGGDILDFNDYVRDFMLIGLDENSNYYLRTAYIGKLYGRSAWSNVVTFKTYNLLDCYLKANGKNLYPKMLVSLKMDSTNEERYIFSSSGKNIYISINDNKYNVLDTKNISFNNNDLIDITITKILENVSDYFILGNMHFGGGSYVGPIKKHFVTKLSKDFAEVTSRTFEVLEDIEVDGDGAMVPYISHMEIKDATYLVSELIVFGTIPHPSLPNTVITSVYILNNNLNITSFKNFTHSDKLTIEKIAFDGTDIYGIGTTVIDIGNGITPKAIVTKFNIETNEIFLVDNKILGNLESSDFGKSLIVTSEESDLLITFTGKDNVNNFSTTKIVSLDAQFTIKNSGVFISVLPLSIENVSKKNNNDFRFIGMIENNNSIIIEALLESDLDLLVNKTKQLNNLGSLQEFSDSGNNIVCFGSKSNILCLNDDIDVIGNGISSPSVTYISSQMVSSKATITNVTNEFIVNTIACNISNSINILTKTTIS